MFIRVITVICFISILLGATGCGSGSCKSACKKIAKCLGISLDSGPQPSEGQAEIGDLGETRSENQITSDTPGWTCPFDEDCSPKERCKAKCVNKATCSAITGEDAEEAQKLADCQAECDLMVFDGGVEGDLATSDTGSADRGSWDNGTLDGGLSDFYIPETGSYYPDLVMTLLSAVANGTSVTFTAEFCNDGASISDSFYIKIYYNQSSAPGCSGTYDDYETIYGLGAGECKSLVFARSNTPTGSYTAWASVDANCKIPESSETNNHKSASYSVSSSSLTDLAVQGFTAQVSGSTVTFSAKVCNNGATTSSTFDLKLFPSLTSAPTCYSSASKEWPIYGLASGSCTSVYTYAHTSSGTPGTYTAWAKADADCVVSESNENNNNASVSYTLSSSTCSPTATYDFDTGTMQGITETNTDTQVQWHVSSNRTHGGSYALRYADSLTNDFAGSGSNSGTASLPLITIPSTGTSKLTFWLWADVENSASYDILYVKVGGTSVWTKTTSNITLQTWQQITVDLSSYKGQSVTISFEFSTVDGSANSTEGVYIDDIALSLGCS